MRKNSKTGAACGRIHPIGTGNFCPKVALLDVKLPAVTGNYLFISVYRHRRIAIHLEYVQVLPNVLPISHTN